MKLPFTLLVFVLGWTLSSLYGQTIIEGYVYESGNRGFLKFMTVDLIGENFTEKTSTDNVGKYNFQIKDSGKFMLIVSNDLFNSDTLIFNTDEAKNGKLFLEHEMRRVPGYIFEITLAIKNNKIGTPKEALQGSRIEVYNNTKKEEILVIDSLVGPEFKVHLKKGNHYTLLVRKRGFLSKRMEAFVDVEGCILCFEGLGTVRPGVSDNLTENNQQGTLLANVEIDQFIKNKSIIINNLNYDVGSANIKEESKAELDKLAIFLNDNPNLKVEIGSHTDSRGSKTLNKALSEKRAAEVLSYLVNVKKVSIEQLKDVGYGEARLLNKCADGVNCTEKEHELNRRTDFTYLELEEDETMPSLLEMKKEEEFEKFLQESVFSESQVMVNSEEELKKLLAQNASSPIDSEDVVHGSKESEPNISNAKEKEKEALEDMEMIEETTITEEVVEESIPKNNQDLFDYSGYKIVVHFSNIPLPNGHAIFQTFENVVEWSTDQNNYLYLIGDFDNQQNAIGYLMETIRPNYPNSFLVTFKEGERVE